MNSKLMATELEKNKSDQQLCEIELDIAKKQIAAEMSVLSNRTNIVKSKTYKKPKRMRLKEKWQSFSHKIKIFFGLNDNEEC